LWKIQKPCNRPRIGACSIFRCRNGTCPNHLAEALALIDGLLGNFANCFLDFRAGDSCRYLAHGGGRAKEKVTGTEDEASRMRHRVVLKAVSFLTVGP